MDWGIERPSRAAFISGNESTGGLVMVLPFFVVVVPLVEVVPPTLNKKIFIEVVASYVKKLINPGS